MLRIALGLAALLSHVAAQSSIKIKWLEGTPDYLGGVTFGLPWPRGQHSANATEFAASDDAKLSSWVTAVWPDGSLKWTGHALAATSSPVSEYTMTASGPANSTKFRPRRGSSGVQVHHDGRNIVVNTGKVTATFPQTGKTLVSSIKAGNKTVGLNGHLVLRWCETDLPNTT
jgi:hypothetical protein